MLINRCVTAHLAYAIGVNALAKGDAAHVTIVVARRLVLTLRYGKRAHVAEVVTIFILTHARGPTTKITHVIPIFILTFCKLRFTSIAEVVIISIRAFTDCFFTKVAIMI